MPTGKNDTDRMRRIVTRELKNCIGLPGGALSTAREELKDAYLGNGYAADATRKAQGWSTYTDRTVLEAVEWAKGPLFRVFAGTDDIVSFSPTGPQDKQLAKDATDYINRVVFGKDAFDITYGPLTEGLYQRAGWAKVFFDDKKNTVNGQSFEGLSKEEAAQVVAAYEVTPGHIAKVQQANDETYRVTLTREVKNNQVKILPIPSERIVFAKDATSLDDCSFIAHWEDKMAGELIKEGYPRELVEKITSEKDDYPETIVQNAVNSEDAGDSHDEATDGTRTVRVYEAYLTADLEKNGELSRYKVVFSGEKDACVILDIEEWDMQRHPFFAAGSLPLPHSVVGLCLADLVVDLQAIRSEMTRITLDNMYLANQGEIVAHTEDDSATIDYDALLNRTAGGIIRIKGKATLTPLQVPDISPSALAGLQMTEKLKEQRTGIGMQNQGLSADTLQNTATGAEILEEAQNIRLDMIARVYAERFYKPMAKYALLLVIRHMNKPVGIQRKGEFAELLPSTWSPEWDVTVSVGLGTGSKQRQARAIQQVIGLQKEIAVTLGKSSPVTIKHIIQSAHTLLSSLGIENPEQYFGSIEDAEAAMEAMKNQPPEPSPEMMKMQMEQQQAQQRMQLEQQKAQADLQNQAAKIQMEMRLKEIELAQKYQLSLAQMQGEAELDAIKLTTSLPKQGADIVSGVGTL